MPLSHSQCSYQLGLWIPARAPYLRPCPRRVSRFLTRAAFTMAVVVPCIAQQSQTRHPIEVILMQSSGVTARPNDNSLGDPVVYQYDPRSSLSLGRGFSPNDVTTPKFPSCISFVAEALDSGPPTTVVNLTYVSSSEQLESSLRVDSKISAQYLTASASGSFSYDTTSLAKRNAITVVFTARTNFGRWGLKASPTLSDEVKPIVGDSPKFEQKCGSRYVAIEERGASVSAVVTLLSVSQDDKASFNSEFSAGGGWGALSATAQLKFRDMAKKATNQDRISVQVVATGGSGFGDLSSSVKTSLGGDTGLAAVADALQSFISKFEVSNAVATEYRVASMEDFGWDPSHSKLWTDDKEENLRELADAFRSLQRRIVISEGIIKGTHPLSRIAQPWEIDRLKQDLPVEKDILKDISAIHDKCMANDTTTADTCKLPFTLNYYFAEVNSLLAKMDPPAVDIAVFDDGCEGELASKPRFTAEESRVIMGADPRVRTEFAKSFHPQTKHVGGEVEISESYGLWLGLVF